MGSFSNVSPAIHRQSEDGWKRRVEKLSKNAMYPQPSMDSPRMAGRLEEEGGKVIREYNVPPAIHGQSEDGWKGRVEKLSENTIYPQPSIDSPRREREKDHRRKVI